MEQAKSLIHDIYPTLPKRPGGWVTIKDVRKALGDKFTREEVDTALTELGRQKRVHLLPEENQKVLTQADRDSAVVVGNTPYHFLFFE